MAKSFSKGDFAELAQKTNFYEQVLNNVPALLYLNTYTQPGNPESLVNLWCNHTAQQFVGCSQQEIDQKGNAIFFDVLHPDDREIVRTIMNELAQHPLGHVYSYVHRLLSKERNLYVWMLGNGIMLDTYEGGHPKTSLNISVEITEQMHTENQLVLALQEINRLKNQLRRQSLTTRERQVLKYIATGYSDKEIGETLFISTSTAKTHRNHIIKKIGVNNSATLSAFAAWCGFI
jgi:DNA-binding CsgD family transcriptional regulator